MKYRIKKNLLPILIVIIVGSIGFNIYQNSVITRYEEDLTYILRLELQKFAGKAGSELSDEVIYAEEYGHIVSAQNAIIALSQGKGYSEDKCLASLLQKIKWLMLNDKGKVHKAFKNTDGAKLIFKISDNFEDYESIEKVFKLLED